MDSNSQTPWFGLNIPLGMEDREPKSVELAGQTNDNATKVVAAQQKTASAKAEKSPGLISRLLGAEQSIPLPDDGPSPVKDRIIVLEGPRETFQ